MRDTAPHAPLAARDETTLSSARSRDASAGSPGGGACLASADYTTGGRANCHTYRESHIRHLASWSPAAAGTKADWAPIGTLRHAKGT